MAQNKPALDTTGVEIGLAFYSKSNKDVDLKTLAAFSPRLKGLRGLGYQATLEQEVSILKTLEQVANNNEHLYTAKLPVLFTSYDDESLTFSSDDITIDTPLFFQEFGEDFVLFLADIDHFIPLQVKGPTQAYKLYPFVKDERELVAEISYQPLVADSEPYFVKDKPHNLLLAKVAELRLWDNSNNIVYYRRADWYHPDTSVLDFYDATNRP